MLDPALKVEVAGLQAAGALVTLQRRLHSHHIRPVGLAFASHTDHPWYALCETQSCCNPLPGNTRVSWSALFAKQGLSGSNALPANTHGSWSALSAVQGCPVGSLCQPTPTDAWFVPFAAQGCPVVTLCWLTLTALVGTLCSTRLS